MPPPKSLRDSKILIVDDEAVNVDLLQQILMMEGFSALQSVLDSREVCRVYQDFRPDLVLLDLNMPHLDGFQVMEQLRAIEKDSYLPVLVLTAQIDNDSRVRALKAGARDYLTKPFDLVEVMCRIRNMLEIRQLYNRVQDYNRVLEDEVRERTGDLERKTEELQDFIFVASHDLQEPLRKINTFGDLLESRHSARLEDKARDYLDRMLNASRRIRQLIADLVRFSEVASAAPKFEPTDLQALVLGLKPDRDPPHQPGIVEVSGLPRLAADQGQMRLLFNHLIDNGLKYCRAEQTPCVRITGRPSKSGSVDILIKDNGIGIEKKYLQRIFKPSKRLHESSRYNGTGMGLALCRKIVERHGGKIAVESNRQTGTTFTITLPLKPESRG